MDERLKQLILRERDQLEFFQLLNDEELEQVLPYFEAVLYPAGSILFSEGDPGGFVAFILSGTLEVKQHTEFKRAPMVLGTLKKRDIYRRNSIR